MLESIFKTILDMTLSSSFLIVAVLIARLILRKSSKVFRKILWSLVALKLIIPFSFESALSLVPHESTYMPEGTGASATITDVVMNPAFDWKSIIPYIWVGGCAILLIYAFFSFIRLKIRMSDSVKYKNNIFQSEKVESPFVFGVVKPKIYIPYNIAGEKLSFVLEHEKTHIKHLDHITKILGFIVLCVHWFNPLVWVSYVLFCKDLELACDEAVVKNMSEVKRKSYALTLCDIGVNKAKITACPIAFGEVSIKERVKATISYKRVGKIAISLSLCLCAVVAVCFMTKPVAEAKEKTEEPIAEESTVPATEPVTEPTTELTTESATEPVTEKESEISDKQDPHEIKKKLFLNNINKETTIVEKVDESVVVYYSLHDVDYNFEKHNVFKADDSCKINEIEETTLPRSYREVPEIVADLASN